MDCTVHGILQARILEWVAFPFSRGSSQPRDQTQVFHIAGEFFTSWATRESSRMNRYTDVDQPACQRQQVSLSVWLPDVDHTQKGTSLNLARAPLKAKSKWGRPSAKQELRASWEKLSSVQSVLSNYLRPHGLEHARLTCPSPAPKTCSNSCPSSRWCHTTISSSVIPSPPAFNLSQHQGLF